MSKLVWLHLSDIHFLPNNEWQDGTARAALLALIAMQISKYNLQVDLVFCTGDIAFGGLTGQPLSAQYALARQFFDQVLKLCKLDKTRLFVVPGNHDIDRDGISEAKKDAWAGWGADGRAREMEGKISAWFAGLKLDATEALQRLDAFGKFVADYLPHQHAAAPGHYHYAQILEIAGRKIGIAGFNSAWTCGGDADDRRIWLAAGPQFDHMRDSLKGADLKIGLIHHPWDWFNVAERNTIRQRIGDEAHFWLHGHTHEAWVEDNTSHITLGAGAVGARSEDEFGCNVVQIDFASGKGQAHLFRYQKNRARWLPANNVTKADDGIWRFKLPNGEKTPLMHGADPYRHVCLCDRTAEWQTFKPLAKAHFANKPNRPLLLMVHGNSNQHHNSMALKFADMLNKHPDVHARRCASVRAIDLRTPIGDAANPSMIAEALLETLIERCKAKEATTAELLGRHIDGGKQGLVISIPIMSSALGAKPLAVIAMLEQFWRDFPDRKVPVIVLINIQFATRWFSPLAAHPLLRWADPARHVRKLFACAPVLDDPRLTRAWLRAELGSVGYEDLHDWFSDMHAASAISSRPSEKVLKQILGNASARPMDEVIEQLSALLG